MPTATLHPQSTPGLDVTNVQPKAQLRRAVYVHVSDLLSAYNIDHSRLEEELRRVKVNRDQAATARAHGSSSLGVPTELDTSSNQKKLHPPRGGFNLCVYVFFMEQQQQQCVSQSSFFVDSRVLTFSRRANVRILSCCGNNNNNDNNAGW